MPRHHRIRLVLFAVVALIAACGEESAAPQDGPARGYRMGFSGIPPRADFAQAVAAILMWSERADAAIMSFELSWDSLLAGVPAETLVLRDQVPLAEYYRSQGHELWIYLDPVNGLNRAGESDALVAAGRSITEPEIQAMFRRYAVVIDSVVRPEHLGLALETNLIRSASPPSLYAAIRQTANDAALEVRAVDAGVRLSVSVQVDWAWGRLGGGGPFVYQGVEEDFADFPFIDELGLSSYPYLAGFDEPETIPLDYYSRLIDGRDIPVMVTEGGWSSVTLGALDSSEDEQRRYITRQSELLDEIAAIAVFQLTFTDLDVPPASNLWIFARLGLVDVDLNPKASLSEWDAIFARRRR